MILTIHQPQSLNVNLNIVAIDDFTLVWHRGALLLLVDPAIGELDQEEPILKSFEKWNAPEENYREGHRGRLKFFSEKENQETQQPHPREGNAPEKNPHCVAVVLPGKDARGRQFLLLLWCCQSRSPLRPCDTEWRRP
ncbi:hypothetical protein GYH30_040307 [Glycine max]|nr:hypothetical protein GYH30_040307 [Glycine max]